MEYRQGFYEERRSLLLKQPDTINTIDDCKHWGAYVSRYIAEAQETIRQLHRKPRLLRFDIDEGF